MLFFQTGLLAGYGYAHLLTTRLSIRWQAAVHARSGAGAPDASSRSRSRRCPPKGTWPRRNQPSGCLSLLATTVGLPFFALSATAPLLQRWFSAVRHASAADPVLPVCGQQRGEPHRAPRLPQPCGTAAVTADAASHLGVRLRGSGGGLLLICAVAAWRAIEQKGRADDPPGPSVSISKRTTIAVDFSLVRSVRPYAGRHDL